YGAVIVLGRWASLVRSFGPHLKLQERQSMLEAADGRVAAGEQILNRANQLLDAGDRYSSSIVEACAMAFPSLDGIFREEREAAAQSARLGPMLSAEYREARRIFL